MTPQETAVVVSMVFIVALLVVGFASKRAILLVLGGLFMLPFSFYVNGIVSETWLLVSLVGTAAFFVGVGAMAMLEGE